MNQHTRSPKRPSLRSLCVYATLALTLASTARGDDAAARSLIAEGNSLANAGNHDRAAGLYRAAASQATDERLRRSAELNAAICAIASPDSSSQAEATIRSIERSSRDPAILAPSRRALGRLEHGRAVAKMKESPEQAIEGLRLAERWFRAALSAGIAEQPTSRDIELTQRLIDALLREQEKQKEDQEQSEDDSEQQKGAQDQKPGAGEQGNQQPRGEGEEQQSDSKQNGQGQDAQNGSQSGQPGSSAEKPSSGESESNSGQSQEQGDSQQPNQQGETPQAQESADANAKPQRGSQPPPGSKAQNPGAFSPAAAQILDKERRERAALERLLRQLSGRPARVEKDW